VSGGLAAFCLAFFRPDLFGKVLCWVGSFTNIRGGHHVSWLVRNTPRRPITVFLADGENDVNNQHGSWPLSNLQLHSALEYAGYTPAVSKWGRGGTGIDTSRACCRTLCAGCSGRQQRSGEVVTTVLTVAVE